MRLWDRLVPFLTIPKVDEEAEKQYWHRQGLIARADHQHAQILAGDDKGLYGLFPPVA